MRKISFFPRDFFTFYFFWTDFKSILYFQINEQSPLLGSELVNHGGLTTLSAAIFVAGEMAGSGVLALPRALVDLGK